MKRNKPFFSSPAGLLLFLAAFAAALGAASCAPGGAAVTGAPGELRFGFTTEPATLDPLSLANTADGRRILFNVFEGLVRPDTEGALRPALAASWVVEEGGAVFDFEIREGVRFHDGSLLTADDVQFSLQTAREAGFPGFDSIENVQTRGGNRVRVTLSAPDPDFLPYLTVGIVRAGNTRRETEVVGTGPFFVENYTVQHSLVLRRFEDFWGRDFPQYATFPDLRQVTIVFLANTDAMFLGLLAGSIDGATLTGSFASQLDRRDFDIFQIRSAAVQLLALNNAAPPLDDIRVRQAIRYSIDAREIIDAAFFGMGEPSAAPIIPGLAAYYDSALADAFPFDPARAAALLEEAGFGSGPGSGPGPQTLSFEIAVPSNFTMHVDTAQVISAQLGRAGIEASIRLVDWATWLADIFNQRQFQATIISLDSRTVSPRGFLSRYRTGAHGNFINFSSADFDILYDAAAGELDEEARAALFREAQRAIVENAASVFIQDIFGLVAFRAGTMGGVLDYPLHVTDFAAMYEIRR